MPSRRETLGVFLALAVAVLVIVVLFVFPGLANTSCSATVEPSSSPGHWFCSERFVLNDPEFGCGGGNLTANGTPLDTNFEGNIFSVSLYRDCIGVDNLGINASVVQSNHAVYGITLDRGPFLLTNWWNWTSPDNRTGFQWMSNSTLALLVAP